MNTNDKTPLGPWELAVVAQIAAEREARRMPVNELAKRVGLHPGSMPRYMKGERRMTLAMVESFAEALGIDLKTLLRRVEDRQKESGRTNLKAVGGGLNGSEVEASKGERHSV